MNTTDSKTKNFEVYTYLLNYKTKKEALQNLDGLSGHLKRHKNGLISCIAQAEKNELIFQKLIDSGYSPDQIPAWFARPKEENDVPPLQAIEYTIPITSSSKQVQPYTRTNKFPQPRNFIGMPVYNYEEIQDYINYNQPSEPTVNDRITQDMVAEYEEDRWQNYRKEKEYRRQEKQERFNRKIEKQLAKTFEPWTTLQILLKIPEWRRWYENQRPQEQTKIFESIIQLCQLRLQDKLARQQAQNYYVMWWQGRFLGKW